MIAVILCGGVGARLWPASRSTRPKPFMILPDGESLMQKTLRRAGALPGLKEIMLVTNEALAAPLRLEAAALAFDDVPYAYVLEPVPRNTAPAIAMAALEVERIHGADTVMFILPSDHLVTKADMFTAAAERGDELARAGRLVTFGIAPAYPETGYGYIEADGEDVVRFVEKPPLEKAEEYAASGRHFWNSGMFMFTAGAFLEELATHAPGLLAGARTCFAVSARECPSPHDRELRLAKREFSGLESISIDYAVMEKTARAAVVRCDPGWSDLGAWDAVWADGERDADNNCLSGEVLVREVRDSLIQTDNRLVAALGVRNLVVVDTPDALLVADKSRSQEVKALYDELVRRDHPVHSHHHKQSFAWGTATALRGAEHARVRELRLEPETRAPIPSGYRYWLVVQGLILVHHDGATETYEGGETAVLNAGDGDYAENAAMDEAIIVEVVPAK